jgi:hypothetical protein
MATPLPAIIGSTGRAQGNAATIAELRLPAAPTGFHCPYVYDI